MNIQYVFRDMTELEYKQELAAFDENGLGYGNTPEKQERFGFVATQDGIYIGSSSGLAMKQDSGYGKYFYLSDLLVEKDFRKKGIGSNLLQLLEEEMKSKGVEYIWTWTSEYEGKDFYKKMGYEGFIEFKSFYPSGHSRIGFIKRI